jgi:hypothetical protein
MFMPEFGHAGRVGCRSGPVCADPVLGVTAKMHEGVIWNNGSAATGVRAGMPSGWWLLPGALLGIGFWVMVGVGLHGALAGGMAEPAMVTQDHALDVSVAALD